MAWRVRPLPPSSVHAARWYSRCGCRRIASMSIPSSSQCNCSTVSVATDASRGQANRSASNRFNSSQKPL
ncbi:conserved hypothetical protein (plasmid) [Cupriavidus necator H16]|uniref:Uncharacterized protein n=1 Tax=Cupriavidus necator (strain ATCC 17699 / DSM 428 / KCTC 22496 / NCIMB 10442 / H16 / Stanier 337) TaxID=381666 RepID=Q7WXJ1_CUPNH|nr:conserved hypothetical protein [Cupriavidus necator H16]